MSDASQREWRFYLDNMIGFAGRVLVDTPWSIIRDDMPELLPLLKALKDEAQS